MSRKVSAAKKAPPKKKTVIKNVTSVNMWASPCDVVKKIESKRRTVAQDIEKRLLLLVNLCLVMNEQPENRRDLAELTSF